MTSSIERYDDLRPSTSATDTTLDALLADLHDAYTAPAPPPGLRAAIERMEVMPEMDRPRPRPARRVPNVIFQRPRLRALAVAGLLAAVVGTGAALVDPDLVNQAIGLLPGGIDRQYAVALNQSRSVCGFTVALKKAYADANRLLVVYTVKTPPARTFRGAFIPALTAIDARRTRLTPLNSGDTAELGRIVGATDGDVLEFDTDAVRGAKTLRLRLTAPSLYGNELVAGRAPATPSCETDSAVGTEPYDKSIRGVTVPGPFAFNITVPLSPKVRTLAPHLTGTSRYGTTITLERLVVTPTETRLYMRGPARADKFFMPMLDAGGTRDYPATLSPVGHRLWVARFFAFPGSALDHGVRLFDDHGEWTVKVLTDSISVHNRSEWRGSVTFKVTAP